MMRTLAAKDCLPISAERLTGSGLASVGNRVDQFSSPSFSRDVSPGKPQSTSITSLADWQLNHEK